ncbi:hypothetical protein ACFX13_010403 [Malus domestica]|uniref:Plus3 domain-containing protein n=1 Tax=Malus domestica TaxID=3750 RepID=A0A498ILP4_MALDO|nr:hypothetical protein DVH24_036484 [Malus domestica]
MSDLELESDLLEAAGRTSLAGKKRDRLPPSRQQRGGSYSDDGSDSRGEDSDDDRGNRKPSQVPLKKRFEPTERGSDEERDSSYDGSDHEGENSDESDFGPDLYKNDADRKRLAAMSELEREMILTNRAEKKGSKDFMEKLRSKRGKAKSTQSRKEDSLPFSRGPRSSARAADKSAAMDDALNKLRAKRKRQQDSKDHHKLRDASKGGAGSQDIVSPTKHRSIQIETVDGLPTEEEALNADDEFLDSDEESSELPTFQDIKDITIPRSKLAKWVMEPFFEELIVGCFVRVGFGISSEGPVYRLCMVQNVVATNPGREYKLEGKVTHKYLKCVWGSESSASKWPMANVSDSPPQEKEFEQWLKEVKRAGQMPSKQEVVEKKETLQKSNTFVYSAATVKQMLQEKKASARPVNVAVEKERLRRQLDVAESKGNEEEVERIKTRLQELEASRQTQGKDSKAIRLAEMNRKNRFENFINASGLKPRNMNLKAGEAGYDPFSRRWTRSRNYYDARPGGGDEAAEATDGTTGTGSNGEKANVTGELGMQATEAALEAAAGAGKLVDTSAPVDKGTESYVLHNFELPISLAPLQKYGGPQGAAIAYMERRQRIEATVGRRVLDDGRRHASTLTIKDYMRRQEMHHAHPDPDS